MNFPNLNKNYAVFGPWTFLREDGPTFRVHGYAIEYENGQWTIHRGPGQIRVKKVTYTPGTTRPAYALDKNNNLWAFLFQIDPDHQIEDLPIFNLL